MQISVNRYEDHGGQERAAPSPERHDPAARAIEGGGMLLSLQRSAGNRATTALIQRRGSRELSHATAPNASDTAVLARTPAPGTVCPCRAPTVQRAPLGGATPSRQLREQTTGTGAQRAERRALDVVMTAVGGFERADSGRDSAALVDALMTLLERIGQVLPRCPTTAPLLREIREDASSRLGHVLELRAATAYLRETPAPAMTHADFATYNGLRNASFKAYKVRGTTGDRNTAIVAEREEMTRLVLQRGEEWREHTGATDEEWLYGDDDGDITQETADYLEDYEALQRFLSSKAEVLTALEPLALAIGDRQGPEALQAMRAELTRSEQAAGFAEEVIPLGILPGDVFVGLLQGGHVIDDFGAGQQHGEQSHRLQWYAIVQAGLELNHRPVELYSALGRPPFSAMRDGNSMWGKLLDKGTRADSGTYSAPGTLNRDLLESDPNMVREGPGAVGLANRNDSYVAPDTANLTPIGVALSELKRMRVELVEEHGTEEEKGSGLWRDYGVVPPSVATRIEEEFDTSDDHHVHLEGTDSGGEPWKVMAHN